MKKLLLPKVILLGLLSHNFALYANQQPCVQTISVKSDQPVEVHSFESTVIDQSIRISWRIASGSNYASCVVERAGADLHFKAIAQYDRVGSDTEVVDYQHIDSKPITGANFYRLKVVLSDGSVKHFNVISSLMAK